MVQDEIRLNALYHALVSLVGLEIDNLQAAEVSKGPRFNKVDSSKHRSLIQPQKKQMRVEEPFFKGFGKHKEPFGSPEKAQLYLIRFVAKSRTY